MNGDGVSCWVKRSKNKQAEILLGGGWLFSLFYRISFLRSLIKFLLRLITNKCEVVRILDCYQGCERTLRIEESLKLSKNPSVRCMLDEESSNIETSVDNFVKIKKMPADSVYRAGLMQVLNQVHSYEKLFSQIDCIRKEAYDSANQKHEVLLQQLWDLLQPDRMLTDRISKDWGDIGFQGDDPKTDFRGMGLLGLVNLVYFAKEHNSHALQALQHSHHPKYGYSYAIVGINLTSMAYELMNNGLLRVHFYNNQDDSNFNLLHFNEVYCFLFSEFDAFWMRSEPENVMAFGEIRSKFLLQLEENLTKTPAKIWLNISKR